MGRRASKLATHGRCLVYATLGERGVVVCEGSSWTHIPGVQVDPPVDSLGAGDTFLVALGASLVAGATPLEAAIVANVAAAITVKKLNQTGTASPVEILGSFERWVVQQPAVYAAGVRSA